LLTSVATQAAWRASVANILADAKEFVGELRSGIAPLYADEPVKKN
jgi:hypothetical protein